MTQCSRCGDQTRVTIMSKFNQDILCLECKQEEKAAPNYQRAVEVEAKAVENRNYNFPGIGLAPEDLSFLAEKRGLRKPGR